MFAKAPNLLNDDGSASMATAFLMAHHGLRRDLARFAIALEDLAADDSRHVADLREEWQSYRATLHGHHDIEDQRIFPPLREQTELRAIIDGLAADHRRIDPLLERGDHLFADLGAQREAAGQLLDDLRRLLDAHLATEEAHVVPTLRDVKQFPAPPGEAELQLYAQGFAWSSHGIAREVLARLDEMLPPGLSAHLPAARAAFEERCRRVWGSHCRNGVSRTSIPDWLLPGG